MKGHITITKLNDGGIRVELGNSTLILNSVCTEILGEVVAGRIQAVEGTINYDGELGRAAMTSTNLVATNVNR